MSHSHAVLLYYKYIDFQSPEEFKKEHLEFCFDNEIKGRVFISTEGINGTVSGRVDDIEKYKKELKSYDQFADIWFKEDPATEQAFRKTHVRVKQELVHSGLSEVNLGNTANRIKPDELNKLYDSDEDFIIVDARNTYESIIGKFKNAIAPKMDTFRDWRQVAEDLADYKDKTVVTYCTGGIRCEKASAFLVQKGFKNVFQLDGGIVSYTKDNPDKYWEGSVFVFDERRIVESNTKEKLRHIGSCYYCSKPTSYYINCHNQNCDKLIVTCHDCKVENEYCCSDDCRSSDNKRKHYHG